MDIRPYDPKVSVVWATSSPAHVVKLAAAHATFAKPMLASESLKPGIVKYLLHAGHTSVFEHAVIEFNLSQVSRSFLAQITRHRMGSFMSASQHYQDYRDYPCFISGELTPTQRKVMDDGLEHAYHTYETLVDMGVKPEEARQVLPNAAAINLLWTVNARSLINFFNLRLCERNVMEMRLAAQEVYVLACAWFPELFEHVGPDCYMHHTCRQGSMACPNVAKNLRDYATR